MCKAKLCKHLCKGINTEVFFSSRINTLTQVMVKRYHSYWKSRKQFSLSFRSSVWIFYFCYLLCLVLKMHLFTKPLGSWAKQMYNPLKWDKTKVKVWLAEHLRTQWGKGSPFSSIWSCQVKPSKYSRERGCLWLIFCLPSSLAQLFFPMEKGRTKETE